MPQESEPGWEMLESGEGAVSDASSLNFYFDLVQRDCNILQLYQLAAWMHRLEGKRREVPAEALLVEQHLGQTLKWRERWRWS